MTDSTHGPSTRLKAVDATIGYDQRIISTDLSVDIPHESFTAIIGPNGCGKSTLLRALARVLTPAKGEVLLDDKKISSYGAKDVARQLGLLPQTSLAPEGIRVADLVAPGRAPYQSLFHQWSREDEQAVKEALEATRTDVLSGRLVSELSGGQRQRVWVAMLLAQQTPIMLLDEPTTFLDIAHQYELMELLRTFHDDGKTVVTVLHDLNQACRYAGHLIVMRDGRIVTTGAPQDVMTPELVEEVFGLRALVVPDPVTGTPNIVPLDPRAEKNVVSAVNPEHENATAGGR
ncbi:MULTISPECIES: ABC transporter ATP-binding protein [unclassified Corynebacterium]|uniref:ABC transporter ATP-binding protein n=1 Tax=unclassified Corynebacterium TaxID=2624378 RepID=UPI0026481412|nr:ABC transporter ATP-binding protein [Corynebacterium sp.]MDN5720999.1 ABC transporter ATP-binding protein [Corynebacterium sp.]MDN6258375.1 ABC transporter ATP-binding protein [Corynebacterium sp.]MDN6324584.1 ABC transporter ATP-binding protein [Corynebacterium sp.]MDN6387092.1 ABC transporter ATP-binding protein [Corynebacterium sp.]MDN6509951.1 ABC transporter ATP-binding protein [Corynebacterium sp.]